MNKYSIINFVRKNKLNIVISFIVTILLSFIVIVFIKNLYQVLLHFGENTLGDIFSQLKNSKVITPFIVQFIVLFIFNYLILKLNINKNNKIFKIIISLIMYILFIVILFVFSILLSKVNGVLFIDVLVSLLKNMGGLGL